ncbi:MAG: hypothetical protein FIB06_13560 [Betaproteobacteria bacterium]|nr:hypothetical protein [Betaproteobacteria bacterium]
MILNPVIQRLLAWKAARVALANPLPVRAVRQALFTLMPVAARVAVVATMPAGRPFPSLLSGELAGRSAELCARDPVLAAVLGDAAPEACLAGFRRRLAAFDKARRALGDCDADSSRDWLVPAWLSACIFREDAYRGELGLPGLLPPAQAMYCSGWHELAEAGERDLRALWEAGWQEAFGTPSPFGGWDGCLSAEWLSGGAPFR